MGKLKDDALFLLNDEPQSKSDEQNLKKLIGNMKKVSLNVINGAVWLKDLLLVILTSFQKHS